MKVLVFGINYSPELVGIGKYTSEFCEWLAKEGDEVTVISGMPYYPAWKILKPYKKKLWHRETINGVKVLRVPLFVPQRVTGTTRILHELSFLFNSVIWWTPRMFRRFDIIFIVAPPLLLGVFGLVYRLLHRTLFVYHIQDLQLEAAKELGLIRNSTLLRMVSWVENWILHGCDYISTISKGMSRKILAKGIASNKLIEFRNWIDTSALTPSQPDLEIATQLGVDLRNKVVLYSGNLGEKQGLDMIVEVAERMRGDAVTFLIVGEGAFKNKLDQLILEKGITNVSLLPLQPADKFGKVLNLATLHLVLQKKAAADLVMPSKLTGILSVGGCALVTASPKTSLYELVTENEIGLVVEPENIDSLEIGIRHALDLDLRAIRTRARKYAETHLDRDSVIHGFRSFLLSMTKS